MRAIEFLPEESPDTPKGSVTRDLLISKLWLCKVLQRLDLTEFDTIYILGSWYGALALILRRLPFDYDEIICVDNDRKKHRYLSKIIQRHGIDDVQSRCQNAEDIDYPKDNLLVINTSTNDIQGTEWLDSIPSGTVVAIQGRDNQTISNGIDTLSKFDQEYPLSKNMFLDEITVIGVDNDEYQRFMKVGIK